MGGREGEGRRREEREGGEESRVRVTEEEVDGSFWLWGHGDCVGSGTSLFFVESGG